MSLSKTGPSVGIQAWTPRNLLEDFGRSKFKYVDTPYNQGDQDSDKTPTKRISISDNNRLVFDSLFSQALVLLSLGFARVSPNSWRDARTDKELF